MTAGALLISLASWLFAGVLLIIAVLAWCSARNAAHLREVLDEEAQLHTLREFRLRAAERTASVPRPDPAKCGTQVRRPLSVIRDGGASTASRDDPALSFPLHLLPAHEHYEQRVTRTRPPQS